MSDATVAEPAAASTPERSAARPAPRRRALDLIVAIHRWAGLAAMAWLIVLGLTGVLIDHPDWRWVRQWTVTDSLASPKVLRDSRGAVIRKFQVDPAGAERLIGGGVRGFWRTEDGGASWHGVPFAGGETPMVHSVMPLSADGWSRLLLATDDGLWTVAGGAGPAARFALAGSPVTAVTVTADGAMIVGVLDRSRLFRIPSHAPGEIAWMEPASGIISGLPERVGLTRLMFDLHFAQGLATDFVSLAVSDFGGAAIILLSVTGFLFWLLPRGARSPDVRTATRGAVMRWLYRSHGPIVGMLAVVPIVVLSLTGVFVGHSAALAPWADTVTFDRRAIPGGAHALDTFRGQIDSVALRSPDASHLVVMTRMGLIESRDLGATWSYDSSTPVAAEKENMNPGHVGRPGLETVGRRGTKTYARMVGESEWRQIEGLRSMVMDAAPMGDGWLLKTSGGFYDWRPGMAVRSLTIASPDTGGIPLDRFLTDLHGGLMIHSEFAWFNDLAAAVATILALTGVVAWWKRKWI